MENLENKQTQNLSDITLSPTTPISVQKPQKTWVVILVVLFLGAIGTAGVLGYYKYTDPSETKIKKAFERMSKLNSFAYEGSLNFDVSKSEYKDYLNAAVAQPNGGSINNIEISFNGLQEGFDTEYEKTAFSVLVKTVPDDGMSLGFDTRSTQGAFFARLSGANNLPFDVSPYQDKWVKIDLAKYLDTLGLKTAVLATGTTSGNTETLNDIRNKKIKEMILNADLLQVHSKSTKKIDGISFIVYNVTIQKENLKKLFLDISVFENARITERQMSSFEKGLEDIKDASGEIWIGKKDGLLYQLSFDIIGKDESKTLFRLSFKDINNKMVVDEPESFVTLEELIGELFGSLGMPMSPPVSPFNPDGSLLDL